MSGYLLRRIVLTVFVLWGVVTLSYVLTCLAPGDLAEAMIGQRADAESLAAIRAKLGMDRDVFTRYLLYMKEILLGNWGISHRYGVPVWDLILERFPRTVLLAAASIFFASVIGVLMGVISGIRQGTWVDKTITGLSLAGISAPVFWIGLILVWAFSLQLGLLPPSGYEEGSPQFLILPAMTLALRSIAIIARISRAAIIETIQTQYLRTAWAKGLSGWAVYGKHALRNASLPIITVIGLDLGSYLSGSVLTEKVYSWPGLGRLMVDAIMARDTALINACVAFMAALYILVNLAIDLCYGLLDPRIREAR